MAAGDFPVPKFHFRVEFTGYPPQAFKEVTGLSQEYEQMEYRAGDSNGFYTDKRLGLTKNSPITFKKGIFTGDSDLTDIVNENGPTDGARDSFWADGDPMDVSIVLMNEKSEEVVRWNLYSAIPTKMTFSDMASDSSEVAIEELEVTYSKMEFEFA